MSDLQEKLSSLDLPRPAAITVGTFDGVHVGHQRLLNVLRDEASSNQLVSVAVAFARQPRSVIDPDKKASYLATLDHRIELLRQTGVDGVLTVDFDMALRSLTASEFISMLKTVADTRLIITGPGARVGSDRLTVNEVAYAAKALGVRVQEATAVVQDDHTVSSSEVRKSLGSGDVAAAMRMLGRYYRVDGTVVTGDRRGRELGFPTANISPAEEIAVPANGIYATVIAVDGKRHMAATAIGVRPTFGGGDRTIEAFILDFDSDIYGKQVELEFCKRLRPELKFDGVEPLIDQMKRDVSETRAALSGAI